MISFSTNLAENDDRGVVNKQIGNASNRKKKQESIIFLSPNGIKKIFKRIKRSEMTGVWWGIKNIEGAFNCEPLCVKESIAFPFFIIGVSLSLHRREKWINSENICRRSWKFYAQKKREGKLIFFLTSCLQRREAKAT